MTGNPLTCTLQSVDTVFIMNVHFDISSLHSQSVCATVILIKEMIFLLLAPAPQKEAPVEEVKKEAAAAPIAPPAPVSKEEALPADNAAEPGPLEKDHEPRLGPRPRSHNRVLNPPGGKSSVVFY